MVTEVTNSLGKLRETEAMSENMSVFVVIDEAMRDLPGQADARGQQQRNP
jgi:hypothetical protein